MKPAIQNVLAYDRFVPQRDMLLDEERIGKYLESSGRFESIESCQKMRVKYRVGQNLRVTYRVRSNGDDKVVTCRTFETGNRIFSSLNGNQDIFGDADMNAVFWAFPNDRKIHGLNRFLKPNNANLPDWVSSKLVAYAPEKCATFQCLNAVGETLAYAKAYAGQDGQRVADIYRSLSEASFRVPRVIHAETDAIFLEAIPGQKIVELEGKNLINGIEELGSALARLHAHPIDQTLGSFSRHSIPNLEKAATIIGMARPDVKNLADRLLEALLKTRRVESDVKALLHGDVHPKNAILNRHGLYLIDFDQAAIGNPAADIGSFLGSLKYSCITSAITVQEEDEQAEAFCSGYAENGHLPDAQTLSWHISAALLTERALRAINRIRPEGLEKLDQLLDAALEIAEGGKAI